MWDKFISFFANGSRRRYKEPESPVFGGVISSDVLSDPVAGDTAFPMTKKRVVLLL